MNKDDIELKALNLLARREHSLVELRRKLCSKGFLSEDVDFVLSNLVRKNLQSDDRFVENYVRSRLNRGFGPLRIKVELNQKGISNPKIGVNEEIWFDVARRVREKKFGLEIPDGLEKIKQMKFLKYKGFTSEQIRCVLTN